MGRCRPGACRFLPFLRPYRGSLAVVLAASLLRPALTTAKVWLLKILIDDVVRGHQPTLLVAVCAGYLGITLVKGLASFADDAVSGWIGSGIVRDLRTRLYDHLQGLSLRFYRDQRLGDLLTRLMVDVGAIEEGLVSGLPDLLTHGLTVLFFLGALFYLDRSLSLIAVGVTPFLVLLSAGWVRASRRAQLEQREAASALTSVADEGLSAIALVKAFAREPFEQRRFERAAGRSVAARRRLAWLGATYVPLLDAVATIGTVLVVWFGVQAVSSGRLSLGGLVVFLGYLGSLYTPIQRLSRLAALLQRAQVGLERVAEILDTEPAGRERGCGCRLLPGRGLIELQNVTFGYQPGQVVLRDVNLRLRPGEMLAIVGESGAGKTTVVSLLLAYDDPDAGRITIDGQDLRTVDPRSVREQISAVLQEPMLFQMSIRENLRYGRLDATDAEIERAARIVGADDFIRQLPNGYDTVLGPRGSGLSGGQRQRLALARALLKDVPVVILDEATSAIDASSEREILRALRTELAGRTILLVTHRLSAVAHADRIAVMASGQIVDVGTHAELLSRSDAYQRFCTAQAGPLPAAPLAEGTRTWASLKQLADAP